MKKFFAILLFVGTLAAAQNSAITLTATDPDGQTWNNGMYMISFVPPSGYVGSAYTFNGSPWTPPAPISGSLNGSGGMSYSPLPRNDYILPANSGWAFTICPLASAPCSTTTVAINQATQSLSSSLVLVAPRFAASQYLMGSYGYNDGEVMPTIPPIGNSYWSVTIGGQRYWNGAAFVSQQSAFTYPSAGIVKSTGTAWATPTFADFVNYWAGGSCVGYLKNDGTCSIPNAAVWGSISGTLANQTDLQTALNAKATYPGAGIPNSNGSGWGTSYSTSNLIPSNFLPVASNSIFGIVRSDNTTIIQNNGVLSAVTYFPSCTANQMLYYASSGAAAVCLGLEPNLDIASGTLYVGRSTATGTNLQLGYGASVSAAGGEAVALGNNATANASSYSAAGPIAIGHTAVVYDSEGIAIGDGAHAGFESIAVGATASAAAGGAAIGYGVVAGVSELALGWGGIKQISSLETGVTSIYGTVSQGYSQVLQLVTPSAPGGGQGTTCTPGTGVIPNGTYYAKIAAIAGDGSTTQVGPEGSVAVTGSSSNAIIDWSWTIVPGAYKYQIWMGTSPGGENSYFLSDEIGISGLPNAASFCQQSVAGTSGTPPVVNNTGSLLVSAIPASTSPVCPNGPGGRFTTTGCTGGSGGSGTAGQLGYYATTGTAISGLNLGTNLSITSGTLNASGGASFPSSTSPLDATYTLWINGPLLLKQYGGSGYSGTGTCALSGGTLVSGSVDTCTATQSGGALTFAIVGSGIYSVMPALSFSGFGYSAGTPAQAQAYNDPANTTIYYRNNSTGTIASGTDLNPIMTAIFAATAGAGGTYYYKNGWYPVNTLTAETNSGCTNYSYGVGIPNAPVGSWVQYQLIGESGTLNISEIPQSVPLNTAEQANGVIFDVTPTAVASVASTVYISDVWSRPNAGGSSCTFPSYLELSTDIHMENITTRLPSNQRGNESGIWMGAAEFFTYSGLLADFDSSYYTIATGAAPVAGASGSVGIVTPWSFAGAYEQGQHSAAIGWRIGWYFGEGQSCTLCNSAFDYTPLEFGAANTNSEFHTANLINFVDQENATGPILGPEMQPYSSLNLIGYDIEYGASGWYARSTPDFVETNAGNSHGLITYNTVEQGGSHPTGPLFASGGGNFTIIGNGTGQPDVMPNYAPLGGTVSTATLCANGTGGTITTSGCTGPGSTSYVPPVTQPLPSFWYMLCGRNSSTNSCQPTASTSVWDDSGSGNTGMWTGTGCASGHYTDGLVLASASCFNGTTDYVTLGTSIPNLTSNWTFSAWFYATSIGTASGSQIYNRCTAPCTIGAEGQLAVYLNPTGTLEVDVPFVASIMTGSAPSLNAWHQVVVTRSGNSWVLYLDGVSNQTATNSAVQANTGAAVIGATNVGSGFFTGRIEDVRGIPAALDATQVATLYSNGAGRP